jgi:hypothetical protein
MIKKRTNKLGAKKAGLKCTHTKGEGDVPLLPFYLLFFLSDVFHRPPPVVIEAVVIAPEELLLPYLATPSAPSAQDLESSHIVPANFLFYHHPSAHLLHHDHARQLMQLWVGRSNQDRRLSEAEPLHIRGF